MRTIEKAGERRAGSGREKEGSPFPFPNQTARSRPPAYSMVLTDWESETDCSFSEF